MADSSRPSHSRSPAEDVKFAALGDRMLGAVQVASMLNLSPRTVRYLASLGDLPGSKVGRAWRFWRSEILEYLQRNRGENLLG